MIKKPEAFKPPRRKEVYDIPSGVSRPREILSALYGRRRDLYGLIDLRRPVRGSPKELLSLLDKEKTRLDICPQRLQPGCTNKKDCISALYELRLDIDNPDLTLDELQKEIKKKHIPTPYAIIKTPHGFHLLWRFPSPISLTQRPWETNEEWVDRWDYYTHKYEEISRALCRALEHLGTDTNSINPARLWRMTQAEIVSFTGRKTSLKELNRAAKRILPRPVSRRKRSKIKKAPTPQRTRREGGYPSPPGSQNGVIEWLRERTVYEGSRNKAIVALAISMLQEGKNEEKVTRELIDWAQKHTVPVYPAEEIRYAVRSLARRERPFNLSPRKLREIKTDRGRPPEELVKKLLFHTPSHPRMPLDKRKKKPRILHFLSILEGKEHVIPRSSRYLLGDLISLVKGLRGGEVDIPLYMLGFGPQGFLVFLARYGLWPQEAHSVNSVAFWMREELDFAARLLRAAADLLGAIRGRAKWARWSHAPSSGEELVGLFELGSDRRADFVGRKGHPLSQGSVCLAAVDVRQQRGIIS